jgi:class 3 adenylate cyclase
MTKLPTGTVTFLFTDIEGSTKLWERDPKAMSKALSRHDELLRKAVEARGGFVFKTVGDAFYVAFSTAPEAVEAHGDEVLGARKEGLSAAATVVRARRATLIT